MPQRPLIWIDSAARTQKGRNEEYYTMVDRINRYCERENISAEEKSKYLDRLNERRRPKKLNIFQKIFG